MANALMNRSMQVGSHLGHPIYETIQARDGTYIFDRVAICVDGEFPLDQLGKDELLIRPGLVYKAKI